MPALSQIVARALRLPFSMAGQFSFRRQLGQLRATADPLILFERDAGIGDIICTLPAVEALRSRYPRCKIVYATLSAFAPIARMANCADAIVEVDWSKLFPKYRKSDFDLVFSPRTPWERWIRKDPSVAAEASGPRLDHLIDEYCDAVGVKPLDQRPRLFPPPATVARMGCRIDGVKKGRGPVIGIHVGPSWPVREWIPQRWTELVELLSRRLNATVIQFGLNRHVLYGRVKTGHVAGAINWVDQLSLEETVAAIAGLDQFVGIDSGLLHIAGTVDTPAVGIFGAVRSDLRLSKVTPTIGVQSDVPCTGCHHTIPPLHWETGCPHDIACMKSISVERVAAACGALWQSDLNEGRTPRNSLVR
jgi:ADP-heptose:LPS heptosyltransferase